MNGGDARPGRAGTPVRLAPGEARRMVATVVRRPDLWGAALGAARRLAVPGWWRRPPHLPLPDGRLWGFRMVTAYGRTDAPPTAADLVSYLEWCRDTGRPRVGVR